VILREQVRALARQAAREAVTRAQRADTPISTMAGQTVIAFTPGPNARTRYLEGKEVT